MEIKVFSKRKLQYKKTFDYISKKCNAVLSLALKKLNAISPSWHHLNIACSNFRSQTILVFFTYENCFRDM